MAFELNSEGMVGFPNIRKWGRESTMRDHHEQSQRGRTVHGLLEEQHRLQCERPLARMSGRGFIGTDLECNRKVLWLSSVGSGVFVLQLYLFLTVLGLRCCVGFSLVAMSTGSPLLSSCSARTYCSCLSCGGAQALGHAGFSSCGTWVMVPRL